jgi:hypothetical protein
VKDVGLADHKAGMECLRSHATFARWLLGLVLCMISAGCATTQPWERETLAKRCMAPDGNPHAQGLRYHYLSTREGAVGGLGGGGGGCGCN